MLDESLLSHLPPFSLLTRAEIRRILDQAVPRRYDEGMAIFHQGEDAGRFFLLLDGYLRVCKTTPEGDEVIVMHIYPGQLFGIAPALMRDTYPATATAATESIALAWPCSLWEGFSSNYKGFATETYRTVSERISQMQDALVEMATRGVESRIASALQRLMEQGGHPVADGIEIGFPITRRNIADMTGTTLHTVSRMLSAWEKNGTIRSDRKRIIITDPKQLELAKQSQTPRR